MTREEEIKNEADIYAEKHGFRVPYDGSNDFYDKTDVKASLEGFIAGAKWADKEFVNKVQKYSISYKYDSNLAIKAHVGKEMIHDRLLIRLIERLKRDGFIEIKETQEGDESTIFMFVNVLKNDFKKAMEE